ncbi:MAG: hypothetical protein EU549_05175, partial [Promethearchaeota archaeon]
MNSFEDIKQFLKGLKRAFAEENEFYYHGIIKLKNSCKNLIRKYDKQFILGLFALYEILTHFSYFLDYAYKVQEIKEYKKNYQAEIIEICNNFDPNDPKIF